MNEKILAVIALVFACLALLCACSEEAVHTHTLAHHEAVIPTCTATGNIEYWECTACGKYFSDADAIAEITDKTSVLIAVSHDLDGNGYCATCGYQKGTEGLVYAEYDTYAAVTGIGTASGDVKIASEYNGKPVTNIDSYAFEDCTELTSITIPSSVTGIWYDAFSGCTGLTGVYITDLAAWCRISLSGSSANPLTYAEKLYLNGNLVTALEIPDGVTSIGNYAFYNCTSFTSITIPPSVTSIGYGAFRSCTGLTSVTFQNAEGWWVSNAPTATSGTDISATDLANPATAARYLKNNYCDDYWKRG